MKLVVTIFDHPKAPITETIELENGWEDIRLIEGDGITAAIKRDLLSKGVAYNNRSDGRFMRLKVMKK
jgi:hypothetical protein